MTSAPAPLNPPGNANTNDEGRSAGAPAPISSSELLRGQRVIEIDHEGQRYRLQATRQGKLILTK
jgi:hemin uptake protein HemP